MSKPTNMVDRVARAILARVPVGYGMTEAEALEYASAAIVVMRESVSKEMIIAAETALEDFTDSDYDSDADGNRYPYSSRRPGWELHIWQAMIDAELAKQQQV